MNVVGNSTDALYYKHPFVPDTLDAALCSLAAVLDMSGVAFSALDNSAVLVNCYFAVAAGDSVALAGSSVLDGNFVAVVGCSVVGLHNYSLADTAQTLAALLLHVLIEQLLQKILFQSDLWQSK